MTLLDFIHILLRHKRWLLIAPVIVAALVFILTRQQPKQYTSRALLYTGVVPTSDGTVNVQARVDVFAVNNAIDNIQTILQSRQVLEEVGIRLMAAHLSRISKQEDVEATIANFWKEHPALLSQQKGGSPDQVIRSLESLIDTPEMRWLLVDEKSIYSTIRIKEGLKVRRSGSSDLLELQFVSSEASICQETLTYLIDSFTKHFKSLRQTEAGSMVQFFEKEVAKAAERLAKCAEDMKQFQVKNRIINYYEQTHLTSIETEHLNGQYYDELMKLAASEQAFIDLRGKLGNPFEQALASDEIIGSQQDISRLLTKQQLSDPTSKEFKILGDSIQKQEALLRRSINKLYVDGRTEEGVSKKEILNQWLDKFIALSEARARVVVMEKRKKVQEKEYDFYAPLGSVLHNFERQMDVAEREYLDLLHSLNQARLRQQSAESSNTLATVDPPNLPLKAEPSKRKILVAAGWFGTICIIIGTILLMEYFDSTLQNPERAEAKTGLTLLGAIPKNTLTKAAEVAHANLMLRYHAIIGMKKEVSKLLVVSKPGSSNTEKAVKDFTEQLQRANYRIGFGNFENSSADIEILAVPSYAELTPHYAVLKQVDAIIIVADGEQTWTPSDTQNSALIEKLAGRRPVLLLAGVDESRLENWLGELPKQRSKFRRLAKRIVTLQFTAS